VKGRLAGLLFVPVLLMAQAAAPNQAQHRSDEEDALRTALGEAGSSPVDFIRALESHLAKYPQTPRRAELERALVKAAIEAKDKDRIVQYGEKLLSREQDDLQVLERVARSLVDTEDKAAAERALAYASRYEELVMGMRLQEAPGRVSAAEWREELDRGIARSLAIQSRALGNLGKTADAVIKARHAYETYPTAEAAREIGRWLIRSGKEAEAIPHIADAFTLEDSRNTAADRLRDRQRMGALYAKIHGDEKGLGDVILQSFDRTNALMEARRQKVQAEDPNAAATQVLDFTLSSLKGEPLKMVSLKGKVVVLDFWATWCGPCRVQHPLYEQVKQKFHHREDVVFLSINTDEDHEVVEPFLKANGWKVTPYFEGGLSRTLQISSIPTTVILDKKGAIFSRMNGFLPDRFVTMLSDRIDGALKTR
jgi:thiol-disulfide isomerase/thioredoxin